MSIELFKELTTEDALVLIETEAGKYTDLYVDMDNAPERKYVKEQAVKIKDILKALDRARIDKSKQYKLTVESQAKSIRERLETANKPFTLLIDEYSAKRAKILADEKAVNDARELRIQIEEDHETGLDLNELYALQLVESKRLAAEELERQNAKAAVAAIDAEREKVRREVEQEEMRNRARAADIDNRRSVHAGILFVLVNNGVNENEARKVIKLASHNKAGSLVINY